MKLLLQILLIGLLPIVSSAQAPKPDGSTQNPLRVMLIPADGGTEDGTIADFQPIFNAVTKSTGINFNIRVGQSYGAVVEAMATGLVDVAFFGPVSYLQARKRGGAELLAVAVTGGEAVYYAGIFVAKDSPIKTLEDLKGRSVAFGDINSTSSFTYQVALMLKGGMDPARDLCKIRMTGSHANSLAALTSGQVDAACLSFDSYLKAVNSGSVDTQKVRVLLKSEPIPNPPIAMHPGLDEGIRTKLRASFDSVHKAEGVTPEMIRGYGGKQVDRYDGYFSEEIFAKAGDALSAVTDDIKGAMLKRAAER